MRKIHGFSLLLGLTLGLAIAGLVPALPTLRAQEEKKEEAPLATSDKPDEKKEGLTQEELDKKLDKVIEDQKEVTKRLEKILELTQGIKAAAGR